MKVKVKVNGKIKYRVISHQTGRNMGTYNTSEAADRRLSQISKHKK